MVAYNSANWITRYPCRLNLMIYARHSTLRRFLDETNRGQAKRIRLLELPRSQLHERETSFIVNSEPRFPAILRDLIDVEWKTSLFYSRNSVPVANSPRTSSEAMTMWSQLEMRLSLGVQKFTIRVLVFLFRISKIDRTCFSNIIPGTTFFDASSLLKALPFAGKVQASKNFSLNCALSFWKKKF